MRPPTALLAALGLTRFVALDLETTGLEEDCEIIEIGLACYEAGQVASRISTLVKPSGPVPPRILHLTGIDPRKLKKAQPLEAVLDEVLAAIGDSPIVAHNLAFDQGVLQRCAARAGRAWRPLAAGLDTVPLARCLLPLNPSHRLAEVAATLAVPLENAHRALDDAEAAGEILLSLLQLGTGLELPLLRRLALLAGGTGDPQEGIFQGLLDWVKREGPGPAWRQAQPPCRVNVYECEGAGGAGESAFDATQWFGADGRLQAAVEGFRRRPQQEELAREVGLLLDAAPAEGKTACWVAEAATGTGKSFAYLLPAMLTGAARRDAGGGPVLVSTHTRNLQDQLFDKDIPRLGRLLRRPFRATVLKGRGNYLCQRRLERLLDEARERLSPADRLALLPVVSWAALTRSGDIEECTGFRAHQLPRLWSQVRSEGSACANPGCRGSAAQPEAPAVCWGARARLQAQASHLVVVNHSLLLADLGVDHGVLGSFDTLIVDEAHQFGRSADQHLRRSFSFALTEGRLRALHDPQGQGRGLLKQLRAAWSARDAALQQVEPGLRGLESVAEAVDAALEPVLRARAALAAVQKERHGAALQRSRYTQKERLKGENSPLRLLAEPCRQVEEGLAGLAGALRSCLGLLESAREENLLALVAELRGEQENLLEAAALLALLLEEDDEGGEAVTWSELHPVSLETTFIRLPVEAGPRLHETLWSGLRRVLFTSATLTVDSSFDWLLRRLGLDRLPEPARTLVFDSPFDLARQARCYVPTWLPEASGYSTDAFALELAKLLALTCEQFGRGTLVLFTSYTLLSRCQTALQAALDTERFPLLVQGLDGSRHELLDRFRQLGHAVLLGVDSFWEGVDVPGEALQILVMTKLPFDVPGEPLLDARSERIQRTGGNAFRDLSVPEAVIRFRQGFGRLIRHETDKGAFLLLDARVVRQEYGKVFLDSLPLPARPMLRPEDLQRELRNFFA
ncbi:MAG: helicase C-terminal domain-containing protein [Candidatus Delongbacteria bacterium]